MVVFNIYLLIIAGSILRSSAEKFDCVLLENRQAIDTELGYVDAATGSTLTIPEEMTEDLPEIWVKCKKDSQTWTTDVRLLSYVDAQIIDSKSGSAPKNSIKISCNRVTGVVSPVLLTARTTWCSTGCTLIPATPGTTNWKISYSILSMSNASNVAPIAQTDQEISVTCMSGSAPSNGGARETATKCTNKGYKPNYNQLISCVGGCTDLPASGSGITVDTKPSTVAGEAPYNIGDVVIITCTDATETLITEMKITCLSTQRWDDSTVPSCIPTVSYSTRALVSKAVIWTTAVCFLYK